jgi:signal transduction histidine kinase
MDAKVFGIGIYNEALKTIEFPATYENGAVLPSYSNSIEDKNRLSATCFNEGKEIVMGNVDEQHKDYMQNIPNPVVGDQAVSLIYLPLMAKGKKLGVITVQSFQQNAYGDYHLYMLRNIAIYAAIALENAASYTQLNESMLHLKETQKQLVQSEKMASLGELTAGIAHEIQNPLNFVNNFSDVNKELLTELKEEIDNGNLEEVKSIANNVIENEQKINHHGRRADAIVKGMLQHSRKSSGQKEPTDINALADEYLRLSYHGLRAKDKAFNATMKTDFDSSVGKVNVISQDMGRVILNLFNNAFYAVGNRKKANGFDNGEKYEPTVSVSTKNIDGHISLHVKDNGNGIPQNLVDKIFQPFFTTKPTGEGTGLGLSLAYDIVKAHGGELKVESKEGEGSEFVIQLPV